jgi:hypothetical protein
MSLSKLASELEETARQTAEMVERINDGLAILMDATQPAEQARGMAVTKIIMALQMQDRIEQRVADMVKAASQIAMIDRSSETETDLDAVWESLTLDELRRPELSGVAKRTGTDDIELF